MKTVFIGKGITIHIVFMILLILKIQECDGDEECDRRPLGTKTVPLPPDNRFKIDVIGINDEKYIPNKQYTVQLYSVDKTSTFIAFTIFAGGDTKYNEKNARMPIILDAGLILPSPDSPTVPTAKTCNSVIQSDITPKTSVEALWKAPPKDNKCVTLYAVLAVKRDVWYDYEDPLSKRLCEDRRNVEDMQPTIIDNCEVCEDAKYLLTFEGMWSYNTHPYMFPKITDLARYSDIVGASHSKNFDVYKMNSEASDGLKMLAEQGNTTKMEMQIKEELGSSVRTIIKALAPPKPNMETTAIFRVTREHHLVSLVTAILPSPDWFLGVSKMELCDISARKWSPSLVLNIYPMDAGTDSGLTFDSANEEAMPPQPVSSAVIDSSITKETMKPFAKLHFELMRTYPSTLSNCVTEAPSQKEGGNGDGDSESGNSEELPSPTTPPVEEPVSVDPASMPSCPMTTWEEWSPCDGKCSENNQQGLQTRFRYHIVDNIAIGKTYNDNDQPYEDKEVQPYCLDKINDMETQMCEATCDDEDESEAEA